MYAVCLIASQFRVWFKHGIHSFANIEMVESGAVKVSIPTTSSWYPGQHIFVRFMIPGLQTLTTHPFTICSLPVTDGKKKFPDVDSDTAYMVLYIWPYNGLTGRLSTMARSEPNKKIRVLLEGPYSGMKERSLHTFDHGMIIAGGSGAGFTLPVIENFLRRNFVSGKPISPKINQLQIVVAFKTEQYRSWYQEAVQDLLKTWSLTSDTDALNLEIYITGSQSLPEKRESEIEKGPTASTSSDETKFQMTIHRSPHPNLPALIRHKLQSKAKPESLGIAVCGPSSMIHDVRNAVAHAQLDVLREGSGEVWLYHEYFGW